jgi:lysophospholipase L1-like esterase
MESKVKLRGIGSICCVRVVILWLLFLCFHLSAPAQDKLQWTGSWSSAQQSECDPLQLPKLGFEHVTLRETVHLSLGGNQIRLRISNLFGAQRLQIRSVTVAPALPGELVAIAANSSVPALFNNAASVAVPAESELTSDAIALHVEPLSSLVVTFSIEKAPACATTHPGSRATSFLIPGDHASGEKFPDAESFAHWYFLSAVEVVGGGSNGAVAVIGDSITDGHGSTTDGNDRWTDVLARRLAPGKIAVLNLGIGGNRVLGDGIGPSALSRFDRDVLSAAGVRTVIIFEGTNDLAGFDRLQEHLPAEHDKLVARLESAMQNMAQKAHQQGLCVVGGTVTPYVGSNYYHPGPRSEADRQAFNEWVRSSGVFDGVIDFDKLLRDPDQPDHLAARADSGDHLHPGPEGYRLMGEGIPLQVLTPGACRGSL